MEERSPPRSQWRLVDRDGTSYPLPEAVTLLGREECHITVQSRSVDLRHAIITYDHRTGCFKVKDLSSLNGTYVNDARIQEQTYISLNHGDSLRLGYDVTVFRVEMTTGSPAACTQSPYGEASLTDLKPDRSVSLHDQCWIVSRAGAGRGNVLAATTAMTPQVAECEGCIKEQHLHHTCDDNAEDTRQTHGRAHSPAFDMSPAVVRPTWDRKDSPRHSASPPWPQQDRSPEVASLFRRSVSTPDAPALASPAAGTPVTRGTPLYGQPTWWGDDNETSDVTDHSRSHCTEGNGQGDTSYPSKEATVRPSTLRFQTKASLAEEYAIQMNSQPQQSTPTVSSGNQKEAVIPGTAFTISFADDKEHAEDNDTISPKMGDRLSHFMPEQLRQSLHKRYGRCDKESLQNSDKEQQTKNSSSATPAGQARKLSSRGQSSADRHGGEVPSRGNHVREPPAYEAGNALAKEKERNQAVPPSVAFLMRKMYHENDDNDSIFDDDCVLETDAPVGSTGCQLTSSVLSNTMSSGTLSHQKEGYEDADSDDGAVSEAGTYTVEDGDAHKERIDDVYANLDQDSDFDSDSQQAASKTGSASDHCPDEGTLGYTDTVVHSPYANRECPSMLTSTAPNMDGRYSHDNANIVCSSLNVEVGHWSALSEDQDKSSYVKDPGLSKSSRSRAVDTATGISGASDPDTTDYGSASLTIELSSGGRVLHSNYTLTTDKRVAMSAGTMAARNTSISPVEPDVELLLGVGRSDDTPVRRPRREPTGELSKERLLQELGIGDAPVQVAERPKLVQELLSSRKHHREDDPVIVSSKNFFNKISVNKSDSGEALKGLHHIKASADSRQHADKHCVAAKARTDSFSPTVLDSEVKVNSSSSTNGHHSPVSIFTHSPVTIAGVASSQNVVKPSQLGSDHPSIDQSAHHEGSSLTYHWPSVDTSYEGEVTSRSEVTARTEVSARTEVLLQPTEDFVKSMSTKRSKSKRTDNGVIAAAGSNFEADTVSRSAAALSVRDSEKFSISERPPPHHLQDREHAEALPRQPGSQAQGSKQWQGGEGAASSASAVPGTRSTAADAFSLPSATRSGRSSTDSLASRGSSDGLFFVPRGKDKSTASGQQHTRHSSESSARGPTVATMSQAASTAAARPNRTFELRRARTSAAPDQASDRSSARSSVSGAGSAAGTSKQRSRSGSLERASEVSLGARIVQRSRQTMPCAGTAGTFATEVRGAKLSLTAKSTGGPAAFTRSDGGRYSMRAGGSSSGGPAAPAKADTKSRQQAQPPKKFAGTDSSGSAKARAAAAAAASAKAELEREKAAWERRRSYDPRKAAALGSSSSVSSTPRQQSLSSCNSSGTASPVTPIALRQQSESLTNTAVAAMPRSVGGRRVDHSAAADGDDFRSSDGDGESEVDKSEYWSEADEQSDVRPPPPRVATQHELQIAKMSSELAKDLELLSRGDDGAASAGNGTSLPVTGERKDSSSSSCDEIGRGGEAQRFVHRVTGPSGDTEESSLDTFRTGYSNAEESVYRPDSIGSKSAFTSYSAFSESGATPPGQANSPALSPVKKKVVEAQSGESASSPLAPDQSYDSVMVSSIRLISNRLSKSTSRILTRLREKADTPSMHSSEEEAEAADRAAETLLGDSVGNGSELPGSQELTAALRTLRRAERNVRAVERALFTHESYPEITPTVTTHERDHYLAEIRRIRDEITGFKPIPTVVTSSADDSRKPSTGASTAAPVPSAKALASKTNSFTNVKALASFKKTYY